MKTTIERIFHVEQPIGKVWSFLSNPTQVVVCVPGASITEEIDDRNYKGQVAMKFGPVSAKYNGQITIEELDAENKKMVLNGKGMDARGKGSADMVMNGKLIEKDGGTDVEYSMVVSVTGMLAQFGSRLINDVSNEVVNQFIRNFKAELSGEEAEEEGKPQSLNAASLVGNVVKSKIGGIFGGKKEEEESEPGE